MRRDLSLHAGQRGSASTWVFVGFAAVALFFLLTEHRAHLYGWLPFLLLAACPLMHLFHGHGGHAGHGAHGADEESRRNAGSPPAGASTKPDAPELPAKQHRH
jgi:hypothetical protein